MQFKNIFPLTRSFGGLETESEGWRVIYGSRNSTHNNFILQFFTHAADNSARER